MCCLHVNIPAIGCPSLVPLHSLSSKGSRHDQQLRLALAFGRRSASAGCANWDCLVSDYMPHTVWQHMGLSCSSSNEDLHMWPVAAQPDRLPHEFAFARKVHGIAWVQLRSESQTLPM